MEAHAPILEYVGLDKRKQPQQDRPGGAGRDSHGQCAQDEIPAASAKAKPQTKNILMTAPMPTTSITKKNVGQSAGIDGCMHLPKRKSMN